MRVRLWTGFGLAAIGASLCACHERSLARLSEVESTRTVNDAVSITRTEMGYSPEGFLTSFEVSRDGQVERTTRLDYDEGRLVELETTSASGELSFLELDWLDGRLREMEYTEADERWVRTFTYDEAYPSRLASSEMERPYGLGTTLRVTETFAWNADGQITESVRESRTRTELLDLEIVTTETQERRFEKSGELDRLTVYTATGGSSEAKRWDFHYEAGRLDEVDTGTGENYRIGYEADRMVELDYRTDGSRVNTELSYEDGNVAGDLRWTPPQLPGALHFDLTGVSFPDFVIMSPRFLLGAP